MYTHTTDANERIKIERFVLGFCVVRSLTDAKVLSCQ